MSTLPVRLDRIEAGVVAWVRARLPDATVLWAPSEYPRAVSRALVVTAKMLSGPDEEPSGGSSSSHIVLPLTATFRFLLATVGESFTVRVSGRQWLYTIPALATVTTIRDAVLALILDTTGAGPLVSATFAAVSTNEISIEALEAGDLYGVDFRESAVGLVTMEHDTTQLCQVHAGDVSGVLEIQALHPDKAPRLGAQAALQSLRAHARMQASAELLSDYTISIVGTPGSVIPIDNLAGPGWSSRAVWRLRIATLQFAAEAIGPIESLRATLDVRRSTGSSIVATVEV